MWIHELSITFKLFFLLFFFLENVLHIEVKWCCFFIFCQYRFHLLSRNFSTSHFTSIFIDLFLYWFVYWSSLLVEIIMSVIFKSHLTFRETVTSSSNPVNPVSTRVVKNEEWKRVCPPSYSKYLLKIFPFSNIKVIFILRIVVFRDQCINSCIVGQNIINVSICELKKSYEKYYYSPLEQCIENIEHYRFKLTFSSDFTTEIREEIKETDHKLNIPINEREQIGNNNENKIDKH